MTTIRYRHFSLQGARTNLSTFRKVSQGNTTEDVLKELTKVFIEISEYPQVISMYVDGMLYPSSLYSRAEKRYLETLETCDG